MREFDVGARGTTWLELFFDLCFVAAVAALADGLVALPTLGRIAAFAGLFVTVWWAWMSFTWFSTAWDNDDVIHRLGMLTAMFLVVVLAAAVPGVYRGNDALYVLAYASMQGVIVLMFLRVLPWAGEARRFVTIAVVGVAGGAAAGSVRDLGVRGAGRPGDARLRGAGVPGAAVRQPTHP
jgi:low temperature requirement protein LtrA